jgi:hypothetical protein
VAQKSTVSWSLLIIQLVVLTALALLLVRGDGPGSGEVLITLRGSHGVNSGDVPIVVLWVVGAAAAVLAHRRS